MSFGAKKFRLLSLHVAGAALFGLAACSSSSSRPPAEEPRPEAPPVAQLLAQAEALYAQREDLARVREAVKLLRQARVADPGNYDATWRSAKFSYYVASHEAERDAREAAFRQGIEAGEAAVRLQPDRPEGHFWLGANLGAHAQSKGALSALSSVDAIRREMDAVIKADEGYQNGSAHMVLGQIDLELPGVMGGDNKRAVERLERGLTFGAQNALLRLRLAEAYLAVRRKEDARKQLNAILSMKPDPDYLPEYKEASAEARRLLDRRFSE
ncbi:MAG: TRAP transporter TatT component family protein [Pyrinomonadaceae bacterium]